MSDLGENGSELARRIAFVTHEEVQASAGDIDVKPTATGQRFEVANGSVLGWLVLRVANLEASLASQQGLLFAAGQQVNQMRQAVDNARKGSGGLIMPKVIFEEPGT